MKLRTYILSLIVLAAFTACQDESVERDGDGFSDLPIHFATVLTKGSTIVDPAGLAAGGGFSVWAYSHSGSWNPEASRNPLLVNRPVTSADKGVTWSYTSPVSWPLLDSVSFFAYAPAGSANIWALSQDSVPEIDYSVPTNPLTQKDLLIAESIPNQSGNDYAGNRSVNLLFQHALSQIRFSALNMADDGARVTKVKKIELRNVYNNGAVELKMPIVWHPNTSSKATYAVEIGRGLTETTLTTTAQDLSVDTCLLFLLPQQINRTVNVVDMVVTLQVDSGEVTYSSPIFTPETWQPGKSYKYQIMVDHGAISVIMIDSSLTLEPVTTSVTTTSVLLSKNQAADSLMCLDAFRVLLMMRASGVVTGSTHYGIYATNDLNHNVVIDVKNLTTQYGELAAGQHLIFDFKKTLGVWGRDTDRDTTYHVEVKYDVTKWKIVPSAQWEVDAQTYATTATPDSIMYNKGSVILQRK